MIHRASTWIGCFVGIIAVSHGGGAFVLSAAPRTSSSNAIHHGVPSSSSSSSLHRSSSSTTVLQMSSGGSSLPPITELKAPVALYEGAVTAGTMKALAPIQRIFTLAMVGGIHIAFGAYLAISVGGNMPGLAASNVGLQKLLMGAMGLPTGLIMTLVSGAELFTGNTALVTSAYMEKRIQLRDLLKNWFWSYTGNFIGSLLMAYLAFGSGTLGAAPGAVNLAVAKCAAPWMATFYRGILCNFLVCMAVYMASGCSSMVGKMSTYYDDTVYCCFTVINTAYIALFLRIKT